MITNTFPPDLQVLLNAWQMKKIDRDMVLRDIQEYEKKENLTGFELELLIDSRKRLTTLTQEYCDCGEAFLKKLYEYERQGFRFIK